MENSKMLIDPAPLEKQVQDCINQCYKLRIDSVGPLAMFLDYIKEAPRIEAKEVTHAKWIDLADDDYPTYMCSNCEEVWYESVYRNKFCPNCGTKMDGGK